MVRTDADDIQNIYVKTFLGDATVVSSCGEHFSGVMGRTGLIGEGKPFIAAFLGWVGSEKRWNLEMITQQNGQRASCNSILDHSGECAFLTSPYGLERSMYYSKPNGTPALCSDAVRTFATGSSLIYQIGPDHAQNVILKS